MCTYQTFSLSFTFQFIVLEPETKQQQHFFVLIAFFEWKKRREGHCCREEKTLFPLKHNCLTDKNFIFHALGYIFVGFFWEVEHG